MRLRFSLTLLCILGSTVFLTKLVAEGTPQASPTSNDPVILNLRDGWSGPGTTGTANAFCFTVKEGCETVHMAFSQYADASGNLGSNFSFNVVGAGGSTSYSVNGTNATNTYSGITAGPGGSGYNDLVFNPPGPGEYCLEFDDPGSRYGPLYWDVSVEDCAGSLVGGRLWSKNWSFRTPCSSSFNCSSGAFEQPFNGAVYALTDDGFVHEIDFANSGFRGLSFFLAFNDSGPGTTGNAMIDRKSIDGSTTGNASATNPLYKTFLQDPDPACYTEGIVGQIIDGPKLGGTHECDLSAICIEFTVNKPGFVEIVLDFDGQDGLYTPNSADVMLGIRIEDGDPLTQCIPWDRMDGLGSTYSNCDLVPIYLNFFQGEIHFMQYDVEYNNPGFNLNVLHPANNNYTDVFYYDDSCLDANDNDANIDGDQNPNTGTNPPLMNLNGCSAPCHIWNYYQNSTQGLGEKNTINTWWFANVETAAIDELLGDKTAPTFMCPVDVTIQCDDSILPAETGDVTAVDDNCSPGSVTTTYMDTSDLSGCNGTGSITRVFEVTDALGNKGTCTQEITVIDSELPMITCPMNVTIDMSATCTYDSSPAATGGSATAMDNCSMPVSITSTDDLSGLTECSGTGTISRKWSAEDDCGNTSECFQMIVVQDVQSPTIVCPAAITLSLDATCNYDLSTIDPASVSDNCTGTTLNFTDDLSGLTGCSGTGIITRTWMAADECANTADCTQMIAIEDQTAPTFTCPAAITLFMDSDCNYDLSGIGDPEVSDNCSAMIASADDLSGLTACSGTGLIIRTWTATDACSNTTSCTQNITISDNTAPTFTCPMDMTLAVNSACAYDLTTIAAPPITDNCPGSMMSTSDDLSGLTECSGTGVIIRTWTATDACSNESECMQNITIEDQSDPVITCPADVTVEFKADCSIDTSLMHTGGSMITDNCGGSTESYADDVSGLTGCAGTGDILRTFTASDACGNMVSCVQTLVVENNVAPLITCPVDMTVGYDASCMIDTSTMGIGIAIVTGSCNESNLSYSDDVSGMTLCSNTGTFVRNYVVDDGCGNSSSCVQNVLVEEIMTPMITCPVDVTIDVDDACTYDAAPGITGTLTATDNCNSIIISYMDDVSALTGCSNTGTLVRTWTAIDDCMNMASCDQNITTQDVTDPVIVCPMDITIYLDDGCTYDSSPAMTGEGYGSDNCNPATVTFTDDVSGLSNCSGTGDIEREWRSEDACGNFVTCTQIINVEDVENPVITCPEDLTLEVGDPDNENMVQAWLTTVSAMDNCNVASLTNDYDPDGYTDNCGASEQQMVTFTATDDCGNFSTCIALITIGDTTPPNITCPPEDLILECADPDNERLIDEWLASVMSMDAGGGTVIIMDDYYDDTMFSDGCGLTGMQEVMFTATDECDLMSMCMANIIIQDTTDPEITCPPDHTIDLNGVCSYAQPIVSGLPTVSDLCMQDVVNISYTDDFSGLTECNDTGVISRTWSATDECGNTNTCVQPIIIQDVTDPMINCPTDVVIDLDSTCTYDSDPAITGNPMGSDNCTSLTFTFTDDLSGLTGCSNTGSIIRTWTATDGCSNTASCDQLIDVQDIIAPTISCPMAVVLDLDVECSYDSDQNLTGIPTGDDNCTTVTFAFTDDLVGLTGCNNTGDIIRTWTVTDECGNKASCDQTLTVTDNSDPDIACPENATVAFGTACELDTMLVHIGAPLIADNCADPSFSYMDDVSGLSGCAGTGDFTRTFVVTDACDNTSSCTQTVTLENMNIPAISCPPNAIVELDMNCQMDTTTAAIGLPSLSGGCNVLELTYMDDVSGLVECGGSGSFVRTFIVDDGCGNSNSCQQLVVAEDNINPVITCPMTATIAMDQDCIYDSDPLITGVPVGGDNCSGATLTYQDATNELTDCSGTGEILRTWTGTDDCGNRTFCNQTIIVVDDSLPTITCPADIVIGYNPDCSLDTLVMQIGGPAIDDNCPGSTYTYSDDVSGLNACGGTGSFERTFVASDACGNTSSCTQIVTVENMVVPFIACPADMTVQLLTGCQMDTTTTAIGIAQVSGGCADLNLNYSDDISGLVDCGGSGSFVRTFEVDDGCGNGTSCDQRIRVEDNQSPSITCPDDAVIDMDANCDYNSSSAIIGDPSGVDNCSIITFGFIDDLTGLSGCSNTGQITRTWTGSDECGNQDVCVQLITVQDVTAPSMTCPIDILIDIDNQCGLDEFPSHTGFPMGADNCASFDFDYSDDNSSLTGCSGTGRIVRTWIITDACGNTDDCIQNIDVQEIIPPYILCPADTIIYLDEFCAYDSDVSAVGMPYATDNCTNVTTTFIDDTSGLTGCGGSGNIVRTWTATDDCGNTATCDQNIMVFDTLPGTLTCPVSTTIYMDSDCNYDSDSVLTGSPEGEDNCSQLTYTSNDDLTGLMECSGTGSIERTWYGTDECSNVDSCTQIIMVLDTIKPVVSGVTDMIVDCDDDVAALFEAWVMTQGGGSATDNCGSAIVWTTDPAMPSIASPYTGGETCVTFMATDDCGNTGTSSACFDVNCIKVAKEVSTTDPPVAATSGVMGNFDVTYDFIVKNSGSTTLNNITLIDDIAAQMGGAYITVVTSPSIVSTTASGVGIANSSYAPSGDINLLGAGWVLQPGQLIEVSVTVEIDPDNPTAVYNSFGMLENQATSAGTGPDGETVDDDSDDGDDPDGEDDPTSLDLGSIGVAKQVSAIVPIVPASSDATGNFDVTYDFVIKNTGTDTLFNISLVDDFAAQMGGAFVGVVTPPQLISTNAYMPASTNTNFNPSSDSELLSQGWSLLICDTIVVRVTVEIDPDNATGIFGIGGALENQAIASGEDPDGTTTFDESDDGSDPIGNNPGEDGDTGGSDDATPLLIPSIGLAKNIPVQLTSNIISAASGVAGHYDVGYEFIIQNTGNVFLDMVQLQDDLAMQMGGAFVQVSGAPTITSTTAAVVGTANANYDGNSDIDLLSGNWGLDPGQTISVFITLEIDPNSPTAILNSDGNLVNQAETTGSDPDGTEITDLSENGNDPTTDVNNDATDDTPTVLVINFAYIGNYVWHDVNANGIQDAGDVPIGGVRVELYDTTGNLISITMTDAAGYYLIGPVPSGDYYLKFLDPAGFMLTDAGLGNNDNMDSDIDESNGPSTSALTTLSKLETDLSWDAGYFKCVPVGELIWNDLNNNDLWDPNENGFNGVKVNAYRKVGGTFTLQHSTYSGHKPGTPSDDGYWKMCLPPGEYYFEYTNIPNDLVSVVPGVGFQEGRDGDITDAYGNNTTDLYELVSGDEVCDISAGFYTMGSIGDRVWNDVNYDGLRDGNEPGIPNITVLAMDMSGNVVASATTGTDGSYLLDYIQKDFYYVEFILPNGYIPTNANVGSDDSIDSDVDYSNGNMSSASFFVTPGEHVHSIDLGLVLDVLPLTWNDIWGEHRKSHNHISWSTLSEVNTSHFVVERSLSLTEGFAKIGSVLAQGHAQDLSEYYFSDHNLEEAGTYYYRIKQLDIDGRYSYSKVIAIEVVQAPEFALVSIYPNPVSEILRITTESSTDIKQMEAMLIDANGRVVEVSNFMDFDIVPGRKEYQIDVSDFPAGSYTLKLITENDNFTEKVIIMK